MFSPLEQFEVYPLVPLIFGFFDISLTNSFFLIATVFFFFVFSIQVIFSDFKGLIVPSRFQLIFEFVYSGLLNIVYESMGISGFKYFSFIYSLFVFVLLCNLVGLVPYSFTVTSHLVVTMTLSIAIWVGKLIVGLRSHGFKLFAMFLPAGAPFAIVPFLVLIELIGFFITIVSLAVRLFANIIAGHILLKVLAGFAWTMMAAGGILFVAHFFPLIVLFLLIGLETGVAVVQAYVFTLLTCLYLGDMLSGGH